MELTDQQIQILRDAVAAYDFPAVVYSFRADRELHFQSMREVESHIAGALCSDSSEKIKDGLSNVLYWGYARSRGRQAVRVGSHCAQPTLIVGVGSLLGVLGVRGYRTGQPYG